jgi:hypothetical protein
MNCIRKGITSLVGATTLFTTTYLFETKPTAAQAIVPCTSGVTPVDLLNSICTTEAATYGITFYQIGLCTNDPLTAQTPNTSSCFFIYNNSAGQYVDIGAQSANRTFTLDTLREDQKPVGAYPYIYAVWGNSVLMKGEATVSTGRYYTSNTAYTNPDPSQTSNGTLGTANGAQYSSFLSPTVRIDGNSCFAPNQVGGGYSILTSNNQPTSFNVGTTACTGAAKLAVSARTADLFGSTFIIPPTSRGINLQFSTPEAIGLIANLKVPGNPAGGYDYVFDFRGFRISLVLAQ